CRHCEFDCLGHLWLIPVTVLPRMRRDAIFLPAPRNHPDESSVGVTGREATSAWGQTGKFVAVSCRYRRAARWCAATRPFVRASASRSGWRAPNGAETRRPPGRKIPDAGED